MCWEENELPQPSTRVPPPFDLLSVLSVVLGEMVAHR